MWIGEIAVYSLLFILWPFTYFFDKGFNDAYKIIWFVFGFVLGPIIHVWVIMCFSFALVDYRWMAEPDYFTIQIELLVYTLSVAVVTWMPLLQLRQAFYRFYYLDPKPKKTKDDQLDQIEEGSEVLLSTLEALDF